MRRTRKVIEQEFRDDLEAAFVCAERALNALYDPHGPKRSLRYRLRLGRAQSALIGLHMQEINRKKKDQG